MKTGKIVMFTTLGALGITSLFMMGSSTASFGSTSNEMAKNVFTQHSNHSKLVEITNGIEFLDDISEEEFNEMEKRYENKKKNIEAIEEAIQNHDFSAWKDLHEGMDILEKIDTEEKFKKLIEMHSIMKDAKINMDASREKADAIAEELGIEGGMGHGNGGNFFNGRVMENKKGFGNKVMFAKPELLDNDDIIEIEMGDTEI